MIESIFGNTKYYMFGDALVFSWHGIIIDIILIFHFFISWAKDSFKTRWKIDFWYTTIFVTFFLSLLAAYPFMASPLNSISIGAENSIVYDYVDLAFYISVAGYISIWIGRYIFDISNKYNPLNILIAFSKPFEKIIEGNMKSVYAALAIFSIFSIFNGIVIAFQLISGNIFDARTFFLHNPKVRPIYNLVASLYPLTSTFIAVRVIQYNLFIDKLMLLFGILLSITLGSRYVVLTVFINLMALYAFKNYKKINILSLLKILLSGLTILFIAIYLADVRELQLNPLITLSKLGVSLCYGNTYSDIRDFAWILSNWNFEYLLGITYLAGFLSFIPSSIISFREEWSISHFTNNLVGFDSLEHSGLRPGMFGEVFLNFGFLGPIFLGIVLGFILRYCDISIKKSIIFNDDIVEGYSKTFAYIFASQFYITAGFFYIYIYLIVNLILYFVTRLFLALNKKTKHHENFS